APPRRRDQRSRERRDPPGQRGLSPHAAVPPVTGLQVDAATQPRALLEQEHVVEALPARIPEAGGEIGLELVPRPCRRQVGEASAALGQSHPQLLVLVSPCERLVESAGGVEQGAAKG